MSYGLQFTICIDCAGFHSCLLLALVRFLTLCVILWLTALHVQKLPAGLATLAVVRKVDRSHLYLYLPHGLTAVAKVVDVNATAAASAHAAPQQARDSDSEDGSSDDDSTDGVQSGLVSLFVPGQYVSCVVLRGHEDVEPKSESKKPLVQVSLQPSVVNTGVELAHLSTKDKSLVWGAVVSKEDHGFVVDLGIPSVHAFLPFRNAVGGPSSLHPGSCAFFTVTTQKKGASSVVLSHNPSEQSKPAKAAGALGLVALKPGMLVNATVKKVYIVLYCRYFI